MKKPLKNAKHELFCHEIINNKGNKVAAYLVVYDTEDVNSARVSANRLLNRDEVRERVQYLLEKKENDVMIRARWNKDAAIGKLLEIINDPETRPRDVISAQKELNLIVGNIYTEENKNNNSVQVSIEGLMSKRKRTKKEDK